MKKYFMLAMMAIATLGFVSCGDEDETKNGNQGGNQGGGSQGGGVVPTLVGDWRLAGEFPYCFYTFTDKEYEKYDSSDKFTGQYTINGKKIRFSPKKHYIDTGEGGIEPSWIDHTHVDADTISEERKFTTFFSSKGFLLDYDDNYYEVFLREDSEIPVTEQAIQGKWYWYASNGTDIYAALTIEGNTFDLIATSDRQRAQGTFEYVYGNMKLKITKYYERDYSEAQKSAAYLDKDWNEVDRNTTGTRLLFFDGFNLPFIANGTIAFGYLGGENANFVKK